MYDYLSLSAWRAGLFECEVDDSAVAKLVDQNHAKPRMKCCLLVVLILDSSVNCRLSRLPE